MTGARWIGALGLALAVTGGAGFALAPIDTASGDSARAVAEHYSEHRTAILVAAYVGVLGTALQVVFFAGLRGLAEDPPASRWLARLGFAAGLAVFLIVSVAFSVFAAVAHREPDPEVARALVDVAWFMINLAAGPLTSVALLSFGIALTRSGAVGRWLIGLSVFAALAHLLVAAAFARAGFLSPEGGIAVIVPLIFFAWFAAVGGALLVRR